MKRDLTELNKLERYLRDNNIQYQRMDADDSLYGISLYGIYDRHQICVPCYDAGEREWDAICQRGSYGAEEGLLEICGNIVSENAEDSVVEGYLTADDVIERIERQKLDSEVVR